MRLGGSRRSMTFFFCLAMLIFFPPSCSRYLRARRWVVEDAYKQFKDTEDWRSANHIDTLYRTIELDAYEQSRRLVGFPSRAS